MRKIRINRGRIFSGVARVSFTVALILGIVAVILFVRNEMGFFLAMVQSFLLFIVWTSFRILEIDPAGKSYATYFTVMARPFNKKEEHFGEVMGIRILYNNNKELFESFLLTENGELLLISEEEREQLQQRLQPVAKKLATTIILS